MKVSQIKLMISGGSIVSLSVCHSSDGYFLTAVYPNGSTYETVYGSVLQNNNGTLKTFTNYDRLIKAVRSYGWVSPIVIQE